MTNTPYDKVHLSALARHIAELPLFRENPPVVHALIDRVLNELLSKGYSRSATIKAFFQEAVHCSYDMTVFLWDRAISVMDAEEVRERFHDAIRSLNVDVIRLFLEKIPTSINNNCLSNFFSILCYSNDSDYVPPFRDALDLFLEKGYVLDAPSAHELFSGSFSVSPLLEEVHKLVPVDSRDLEGVFEVLQSGNAFDYNDFYNSHNRAALIKYVPAEEVIRIAKARGIEGLYDINHSFSEISDDFIEDESVSELSEGMEVEEEVVVEEEAEEVVGVEEEEKEEEERARKEKEQLQEKLFVKKFPKDFEEELQKFIAHVRETDTCPKKFIRKVEWLIAHGAVISEDLAFAMLQFTFSYIDLVRSKPICLLDYYSMTCRSYIQRRWILELLRNNFEGGKIFEKERLCWVLLKNPSTELAAWLVLNKCNFTEKFLRKLKKFPNHVPYRELLTVIEALREGI